MLGTTIGRYEILAELGRGAYGVVWKGRHTLLPDRLVALKVLSEKLWSSQEARDRFLREAIAVSRLDHPGIAALYDAEEIGGHLAIAFKFIDGETVRRHVHDGPLPIRRAVAIGRDAAEALAHAHAHGVIHRDVSPGNLMVDREGRGILVDFGLAHSGETATATVGIVGTPAYAAPEVLRGESADARSDLYSLGAVMYHMITGRAPFEGRAPKDLIPPAPSSVIPTIPNEVDFIVLNALEKNRGDRYASADEMASALSRLLARPGFGETSARPRSPLNRLLSSTRRVLGRRSSRWLSLVAVLGVVAFVGLGIAWMGGWRPTPSGPVIAVLPAQNVHQGSATFIGETLGEDLITRLGHVSNLRLVPWITTQQFTSTKSDLREIGAKLEADKIVVERYRSYGERVWVTVALVDAHTGLQSWSNAYDESILDLPTLQKNIAMGIASQLRELTSKDVQMLSAAMLPGPEAYQSYLRGGQSLHRDY